MREEEEEEGTYIYILNEQQGQQTRVREIIHETLDLYNQQPATSPHSLPAPIPPRMELPDCCCCSRCCLCLFDSNSPQQGLEIGAGALFPPSIGVTISASILRNHAINPKSPWRGGILGVVGMERRRPPFISRSSRPPSASKAAVASAPTSRLLLRSPPPPSPPPPPPPPPPLLSKEVLRREASSPPPPGCDDDCS